MVAEIESMAVSSLLCREDGDEQAPAVERKRRGSTEGRERETSAGDGGRPTKATPFESPNLSVGNMSGVTEANPAVSPGRASAAIGKSGKRENWREDEHMRFKKALKKYGRNWKMVEKEVGTRNAKQIRSHAQKFFIRLVREQSDEQVDIPPARKWTSRKNSKAAHDAPDAANVSDNQEGGVMSSPDLSSCSPDLRMYGGNRLGYGRESYDGSSVMSYPPHSPNLQQQQHLAPSPCLPPSHPHSPLMPHSPSMAHSPSMPVYYPYMSPNGYHGCEGAYDTTGMYMYGSGTPPMRMGHVHMQQCNYYYPQAQMQQQLRTRMQPQMQPQVQPQVQPPPASAGAPTQPVPQCLDCGHYGQHVHPGTMSPATPVPHVAGMPMVSPVAHGQCVGMSPGAPVPHVAAGPIVSPAPAPPQPPMPQSNDPRYLFELHRRQNGLPPVASPASYGQQVPMLPRDQHEAPVKYGAGPTHDQLRRSPSTQQESTGATQTAPIRKMSPLLAQATSATANKAATTSTAVSSPDESGQQQLSILLTAVKELENEGKPAKAERRKDGM